MSKTTPPSDFWKWQDAIAVVGIMAIIVYAGLLAWFYGTGGEVAAQGMTNAVIPVVGTIVGLVFGVSTGTKMGTAVGQKKGDIKVEIAKKALATHISHLEKLHRDAQSLRLISNGPNEAGKESPEQPVHLEEFQRRVGQVIDQAATALQLIS
jgi:hypothetical protein